MKTTYLNPFEFLGFSMVKKGSDGEKKGWQYFLDKFDNTTFTINFLLGIFVIFLIFLIAVLAIFKAISPDLVTNIAIMVFGVLLGAIVKGKNGNSK